MRHLTALRNVRGFFSRHFSGRGRGRVRRIVIACITHDDTTTMHGVVNKLHKRTTETRTAYDSAAYLHNNIPRQRGIVRVYFHGAGGSSHRRDPDLVRSRSSAKTTIITTIPSRYRVFRSCNFKSQVSYGVCVQRENV